MKDGHMDDVTDKEVGVIEIRNQTTSMALKIYYKKISHKSADFWNFFSKVFKAN